MSFSFKDRKKYLKNYKEKIYDLVIIGGGINGAGVARDATSRGMSVALVEAGDFAQGTSSRSSKLIHGGIRYLENYDFYLVFESLFERKLLFEIAPNLVHPLRFMLPVYKDSRVSFFTLGLGMWLYDILALFEMPELHERLGAKKSLQRVPSLCQEGLLGSYVYSDAYMDDSRLTFETLRSAQRQGAECVNYVSAVGAEFENEKMTALEVKDNLSKDQYKIRGKHFVSTVGPWTDQVATNLLPSWKKIMRPSKGVHLIIERSKLPISCAVVMGGDKDKRIIFAIPQNDMVILGTTDTDYTGDPDAVCTNIEDVNYILKVTQEYFPGAKIQASDVISSYAGVRPLVHDGSINESKTSREHQIINDHRNITFVAGGKYTTYRRMAEQAVDSLLSCFNIEDRVRFHRNDTKKPLHPWISPLDYEKAQEQTKEISSFLDISEQQSSYLLKRYGLEVFDFKSFKETATEFCKDQRVWAYEALQSIENTMCLSLRDFYLRRTHLFLSKRDHGLSLLEDLKPLFADLSPCIENTRGLRDHIDKELYWKKQLT